MLPTRHPHDYPLTDSLDGLVLSARRAGRWVAIANCRLDENTWRPIAGRIVDDDGDFAALNARLRDSRAESLAIVFVEPPGVAGARLRQPPPPADLLGLVPHQRASGTKSEDVRRSATRSHVRSLLTGLPVRRAETAR